MNALPRANMYIQLWIILLLLLSACAPTPTATQSPTATTAPTEEAVPTKTQSLEPTVTAEPTPTGLSGPSYTNPVYNSDFPDPHVILVDGTYYAYSTVVSPSNIQVISSKNLVNWEDLGDALPALPKWAMINSGFTWAPGVIQIEDTFVMYYVARDKEADLQCIGREIGRAHV